MADEGAAGEAARGEKRGAALSVLGDSAVAYVLVQGVLAVANGLGLELREVPGFDFLSQLFGDQGARVLLGLPGPSALVGLRSLLARATAWLALLVVLGSGLVLLASMEVAPMPRAAAPPVGVILGALLALLLGGGVVAAVVGLFWVNREAIDEAMQKQAAIQLGFDYELEDDPEPESSGNPLDGVARDLDLVRRGDEPDGE